MYISFFVSRKEKEKKGGEGKGGGKREGRAKKRWESDFFPFLFPPSCQGNKSPLTSLNLNQCRERGGGVNANFGEWKNKERHFDPPLPSGLPP